MSDNAEERVNFEFGREYGMQKPLESEEIEHNPKKAEQHVKMNYGRRHQHECQFSN